MPRTARILLSKSYYHVMTRGNNKNIVFKNDDDFCYYLKLLGRFKLELPFNLYHYCLMPNHTHMLVQTNKADDFSLFMKKINLAYFHHYKQKYGWVGHFWQDRFKSQVVGKDDYFIQCGKYIELNPVRKRLVLKPEKYKYSSYKYYANNMENKLITEDFLYHEIGTDSNSRQKKYQEMIVNEIVTKNYSKIIWGSDRQRYNENDKRNKFIVRHNKSRN